MDNGVETFIQLLLRTEEVLVKLTGLWYRQIPLELVDENEASKASETTSRSRR